MPRIFGSQPNANEAVVPTSYKVDSIVLTNHGGASTDISALVTDFSITESIYLPSLVLSLNIKDPVNLLEEYELSGQETINVQLSKRRFGETTDKKIDLTFQITEYPVYGKMPNRLQVYTVKGISTHAYKSKFKKISRAFSGDLKRFVKDILQHDLGYSSEDIYISDKDALHASVIVPNLAPIDAIAWILRRCFDAKGSPWYCYETMEGGISVEPQSDMVLGSSHRTYRDAKFFNYEPYTKEDYEEREQRILSIASDLRMSKYIAGASGAYASTSEYIDVATKTRVSKKFDYSAEYKDMNWLNPNKNNLDPDYGYELFGVTLSALNQAQINYVPINSKAFPNNLNYHSGTRGGRLNRAASYIENLDNITHELRVAGDFGLSVGKVVDLVLSKSIDPSVQIKNELGRKSAGQLDETLSGRHLVTAVVHEFGDEYFCSMKVKKDSVSVSYYE